MQCKVCKTEQAIIKHVEGEPYLACFHRQSNNPDVLAVEIAIYESELETSRVMQEHDIDREQAQDIIIESGFTKMQRNVALKTLRTLRDHDIVVGATERVEDRLSSSSRRFIRRQ